MRVLWISSHGGNYKDNQVKGTGGWVGALQKYLVESHPDMEIGICFTHPTDYEPIKENNVTYFPIYNKNGTSKLSKLYHRFFCNDNESKKKIIQEMMKVVATYDPDIIHIWGIENDYADIIPLIKNIPLVVHIQGLTSACLYSYCPPSFSIQDIFKTKSVSTYIKYKGEKGRYREFIKRANRELDVSRYVKNWIGRTEWDKSLSKILNQDSNYYHCDEMMRTAFNISKKWVYHFDKKTIHIQSTISEDWYKGMDVVLKTAEILKEKGLKVIWKIFGWDRNSLILKSIIKKLNISPEEVGVECCGKVNSEILIEELLKCDMYVHPSYIENSSNAIAEAQLLGVPVVAQYVGGNPTMLKENSGILVQPNEPYILASAILSLLEKETAEKYSHNALTIASQRQNIDNIFKDLMKTYQSILLK